MSQLQQRTENDSVVAVEGGRVILRTHSAMSCFKSCARKYQYRYEVGLVRDREATPLRMGSAVHEGIDRRQKGESEDDAILHATEGYAELPMWAVSDELVFDWLLEREIVARLLSGYFWRWSTDPIEVIASELDFALPLRNPDTGRASTTDSMAGKIDGIIRMADGRLAVKETKTTGDSIEPDSDYWRRLRIDQQISLYMLAARELGHDVQTVYYDVIRKPSIKPKLVSRVRETVEQYGDRLTADIAERPDFYFARREIPRLEADLEEFRWELWDQHRIMADARRFDRFPRNTSACLLMGRCEYLDICSTGYDLAQGAPAGFKIADDVHPELSL